MAINLASKYSTKLDERFKLASLTDAYAGKKYDFEGVNTIKVYSVNKVDPSDYSRTATSFRFGTVNELGDTVQTMLLTKDRGLTFAIDHGNAQEQFNVKHCNEILKSNWDEVVTPEIDTYRFKAWANGAGQTLINSTALAKGTVIEAIAVGNAALSNMKVPKSNRVIFIKESVYVSCKLATEVMAIESIGGKALSSGVVGTIDGVAVVPVPDSYFPSGVNFIIKYKDATVDPQTLKTLRVQKSPIGFDADVGECRYIYDSFVLDQKVNGIYVHAKDGMCAALTGDNGTTAPGKVTLACATSGTTIKYTTDGSNPKTSATAETYSAAFTTPTAPATVRAYASKTGLVNSAIFELEITA